MNRANSTKSAELSKNVTCECGFIIFTGEIVRARMLRVEGNMVIAKCKRCKREVLIPNINFREVPASNKK